MIACLLIPGFALRAALRSRPRLALVPAALAPEPGREALVGPVTAAAEAAGVQVGMRMGEALATCPDLVLIEQDPAAVEDLRATGIPFVEGNAAEDEHLRLAGVERARGLIAAVGSDEDNVFIILSARLLNPALYLVARAGREESIGKLTRVGANRVMSPYVVGGRALAAAAAEPGLADFVEMVLHREDIDLEIALIPLPPNSPAINQPMQGSGVIKEQGAMILAIMDRTGQFHTNPYPLSTLTEGDRLIAMGTRQQLEEVRRVVGG